MRQSVEKRTLAKAVAATEKTDSDDFDRQIDEEDPDRSAAYEVTQSKMVSLAIKNGFQPNDFVEPEIVDAKIRRENAWRRAAESLAAPGVGEPADLFKRTRTAILHDESPREYTFLNAANASPEELLARQLNKEPSPDRGILGMSREHFLGQDYGEKLLCSVENRATVQMMKKHKTGIHSMMDAVRNFSRENPEAVDDLVLSLNKLH